MNARIPSASVGQHVGQHVGNPVGHPASNRNGHPAGTAAGVPLGAGAGAVVGAGVGAVAGAAVGAVTAAVLAAPAPAPVPRGTLVSCKLPTQWGEFDLHGLVDVNTGAEHAAMSLGRLDDGAPVLTRLHSECLTGDTLYSLKCDCGAQLEAGLKAIAEAGCGVLLYLRQEGRGIGLVNKIRAYALQQAGADTVEANRLLGLPDDARDYAVAADMLRGLGVQQVRLLTNNPAKVEALERLGIAVVERVPLHTPSNPHNAAYLRTKSRRMGHYGPDDLG